MLSLKDVHTYYGDSHVLKGLSFQMRKGELATLLGRNGAGKSTALKSIMGLVPPRGGSILLEGTEISTQRPHKIASMGVGYVPEERIIFPSLSVAENLSFAARRDQKGLWDPEKIFRHFPIFRKRSHHKGSQLSGGEQQMLAIARVLMMNVSLILLDEPTEGLAPLLVREIGNVLTELKKSGVTLLLVEQNTRFSMEVADRHHILYEGKVAYQGDNEEFKRETEIQSRFLGL